MEGLLLMPLIAAGVYVVLLLAPRMDPGRANYAGFAAPYAVIRLAALALMAVVYGFMLQSYQTGSIAPGGWLPVLLGGLFVVLGNQMGKLRPNWFVGVRTPWTLSSRRSWNLTHRLAGWILVFTGVVFWVAAAAAPARALVTGATFGGAGALVAIVYSYFVWRGDPDKTPPAGTLPVEESNG